MWFILVWVLLCFGISAQAESNTINHNWSELSQVQYVDNLVACELKLQEYKWLKNIWPEANQNPKPNFSEVLDIDMVWEQVLENLKMQSILADKFNTIISDKMLQNDLDRMAGNSKDAKGLKVLFKLFDNNPNTIAQCLSRPYLVKQKTQNNYSFNTEIHADTKTLAQTELQDYLSGSDADELKAQVSNTIYEVEQQALDDENHLIEHEELTIKLNREAFNNKVQQLQNSNLQEKDFGYIFHEILEQNEGRIKVQTLTWDKAAYDLWLQAQNADIYFPALQKHSLKLPTITGSNSLPEFKAGAASGSWESKYYTPDGRQYHTAVWSGSEMIIWGGEGNGYDTNTGGRYSPATDSWIATSVGTNVPSAREYHTAIWSGSEMIVWGGSDKGLNFFNTGGRYNPATDSWLTISIGANVPGVRREHTAIWTGDEMIVWGGFDYSSFLNTGGRYDPDTDSWEATGMGVKVPSGRRWHTAIWNASEMIVWGGSANGNNATNTGGRYSPDTNSWIATSVGTNAPSARRNHTAIWSGAEMIVWGGRDATITNTGGRYNPDLDSWVITSVGANVPNERRNHTAIWSGSEMIVWGGWDIDNGFNTGGRYIPATDSWIATGVGANVPSGRGYQTAIWTGSEMIIWGGYHGTSLNTGGRYNPANDSWIASSMNILPSARYEHTAIWSGSEMIVWGGDIRKKGGRYNPATDSWASTSLVNVPTERRFHTAVWSGSEMIIWGGNDYAYHKLNSGGRYDPINDSWIATNMVNVPSVRHSQTAIWTGAEMIVWGGWGSSSYLNTGGRYNPVFDSWIATSVGANTPNARHEHTSIWSGSEMIVWGGTIIGGVTNTGGRYDPDTDMWLATGVGANVPDDRRKHTAIWTGNEMIVWGGNIAGTNNINTGGRYDPYTDNWLATSVAASAPNGRLGHTAIWTGSEMIIWGGYDSGLNILETGGHYDPITNSWLATSVGANLPNGRSYHTAIWTGGEMIVWGGSTPLPTNSLGIYYPYNTYDTYSISGTLSGLIGNQVILQNNGGDDLILTANSVFQFSGALAAGFNYEITVLTHPQSPAQNCTVTNGSGTVTADVTDVAVHCNAVVDLIFRNGFEAGPSDLIFRDGFDGP